jgi:hypothetical protein
MFWKGRSRKTTIGLIMVMIVMRRMMRRMIENDQGNEQEYYGDSDNV